MFRRLVFTAAAAGLAAGLFVTLVQSVTTTPLIVKAEAYEKAAEKKAAADVIQSAPRLMAAVYRAAPAERPRVQLAHDGEQHEVWSPGNGLERLIYTALANVLAGVGFGLIVVACFALRGRPVAARDGMMWGLAGFAVFTLAPSLGLAPELPGTAAADLMARQLWWALAAASTAAGLYLLVFVGAPWAKALGVLAIMLPHVVGAPHPPALTGGVPPELAAQFAAASIVVQAMFWAVLGWLASFFYARFAPAAADSRALETAG